MPPVQHADRKLTPALNNLAWDIHATLDGSEKIVAILELRLRPNIDVFDPQKPFRPTPE